jgi:hypothetical protein
MAGLLNRGNPDRLDLSAQIRILAKFCHDFPQKLRIQKIPLSNTASRRLLIRPIPIHHLVATDFLKSGYGAELIPDRTDR